MYMRMLKKRSIMSTVKQILDDDQLQKVQSTASLSMTRKGSYENMVKSASQITIPGPQDYYAERSLEAVQRSNVKASFNKA
jgi:hypothetical protein